MEYVIPRGRKPVAGLARCALSHKLCVYVLKKLLLCMGDLLSCMFVSHILAVTPKTRREHQIPSRLKFQTVASHHVGVGN